MNKNLDKDGWQGFLTLCTKIKSSDEFRQFFELFLTLEEQEVIGKRYLIIKALESGELTQREIAEKFKVSISQITRGSNALKIIDAELLKFLKTQLK